MKITASVCLSILGNHSCRAVLATAYLLLLCPGCLRYVPSKDELEKQYERRDGNPLPIAGPAEFDAHEATLNRRLNRLIAERSYLMTQADSEGSYRIGTGDIVTVSVFGFGELKTEAAEVSTEGTVALPLLGEVSLEGKNLSDARTSLAQHYSKFIRSPTVDLSLKSYQSNRVSVIGEVMKPGMYPLRRTGQLLTELLSEAGGRNERASSRIILLPRQKARAVSPVQVASLDSTQARPILDGTATLVASVEPLAPAHVSSPSADVGVEIEIEDLVGLSGEQPLLVPLMPGDTIVVPEAGRYEVDGEVVKAGSFVLAARTSALGAIANAGGFTYSADVQKVEVIRDIGAGKKALITLDLEEVGLRGGRDVRLRNGDIVRVPSEAGRFFRRQIVEALNSVFRGVGVTTRP